MNQTLSVLQTVCERARFYLDDSTVDGGKYTDDYLVRHIIQPSMVDVLSRLSLNSNAPVLLRFTLPLSQNVKTYQLPPSIEQVVALEYVDEQGTVQGMIVPYGLWSAQGQGWRLQGSSGSLEIVFDRDPLTVAPSLSILYISNGDFLPHYGTGTLSAAASGLQTLTLPATPTLGILDRRESAYLGFPLRILPTSPSRVQSRLIRRHWFDGTDWKVEVDAFDGSVSGSVPFEIFPSGFTSMVESVACLTAMKLATARNAAATRIRNLTTLYLNSMKTTKDNFININASLDTRFERNTPGPTTLYVPR
jgi:hypothetical protein